MCVICASAKGKRLPTEGEIRQMFEANPDGAGYMYCRRGMVFVRKGFMDVDSLLTDLKISNLTKNEAVVYHFRISTQAGITPEMTQPFIVSNKLKDTKNLTTCGNVGFAHNGIIKATSTGDKTYSDTAIFVANCAAKIISNAEDNHNSFVQWMLEELAGYNNRFAVLSKDGYIKLIGDWDRKNDLMFSNLFWAKQNTSYSYKTCYPSWKHDLMESYQSEKHNAECKKPLNFL